MINIDGYYIDNDLRKDRNDTALGRGGGLIVYVRNDVTVNSISEGNDFNQYCKFSVKLNAKCRPLFVTLIYRSPNATSENTLKLANLIEKSERNSLMIGDFNLPNLCLASMTSDAKGRPIADATSIRFLENLVDFPTHVRGNTLDLALADEECRQNIFNVENIGNLSNSDHAIIKIELIVSPAFNGTKEKIHDWKKGDQEGLKSHLENVNFQSEFQNKDVTTAWATFRALIEDSINRYIPLVERRKKGDPKWMTRAVKNLVNRKQKAWRRFSKNRSDQNFEKYKLAEKQCKKGVSYAKRKFERNIAASGNKRPFSSYVRSKTKSRANVGPLKVNGKVISENKEMSSILNEYFTSVYSKESAGPVPEAVALPSLTRISNIVFSVNQVKKKLLALRSDSAPGPDRITPRFLKDYAESIAPALTLLFNMSMEEGVVPEDWRRANVTPVFKKGIKGDPGNYRPVSLTSVPCRVMESCIRDELVSHLEFNSLINRSQHGFMRNKSCTTNLLEFLERVTMEMDSGNAMDIVYLDFSKAFDKVPHRRLVEKIKAHSIDGRILTWISSWLSNRRQRTVLNGETSDWREVDSGVPQGSVLGPLAFVIFINDLDDVTDDISIMNKFADDTKCGHVIKDQTDIDTLQNCLDRLTEWANKWGMSFNVGKCKVMHVGRANPKATYTMNDIVLGETEEEKDIGVKVHCSLKPSKHCSEAAQRANNVLGQISRSFHYRDRKIFVQLYKQYVRPHLEFAVPAWCPWLQGDVQAIEKVQERAVRMVAGLSSTTYKARLEELGLPSLETRRVHYDLAQVYKIIRRKDDVDPATWFDLIGPAPERVTRHTHDPENIRRPAPNSDIRRHFFSARVVDLWNSLPSEVKKSKTVATFKSSIEKIVK